MFERKSTRQEWYHINGLLNEISPDATAKEALQHILGDGDGWSGSNYVLKCYDDGDSRSALQRFNYTWVWPLFILCTPFQWVFTGKTGVTRGSRIGNVLNKLVGLYS